MTTYRIIRMYEDSRRNSRAIETGLTLEEARAHCHNPETNSKTAISAARLRYTARVGAWFDGYEEETD